VTTKLVWSDPDNILRTAFMAVVHWFA
jgi:hypothetical protein